MGGNSPTGWIVWTPDPGMSNVIVSGPWLALAFRIACRKEPGPLSSVLVTTKLSMFAAAENSEVLPAGSVAVAVTNCQYGSRAPGITVLKLTSPLALV